MTDTKSISPEHNSTCSKCKENIQASTTSNTCGCKHTKEENEKTKETSPTCVIEI